MKIRVLTIESEFESAERLGYSTYLDLDGYASNYDDDIVVRWGCSTQPVKQDDSYTEYKQVINPSKAIHSNCIKSSALRTFSKVVLTPTMWDTEIPKRKTAVVRPHEHTGGNNFEVIKGPAKLKGWTYATEFIKTDKEYRCWFAGQETLCALRVPINEEQKKPTEYPNRAKFGYQFCNSVPNGLKETTLKSAEAIGLHCGAADILFKDGKYYILEQNSAPSIDNKKIRLFYQEALPKLISQLFPNWKGEIQPNASL